MSIDLLRIFVEEIIQNTVVREDFCEENGIQELLVGKQVTFNNQKMTIVAIKSQNEKTILSDSVTDLFLL